jgi:type IV pilus assembly protein PilV
MKRSRTLAIGGMRRRERGFSMVEVLVSLIIIAVGMLGLAKIQALAYANTGIANQQSMAALEAASMASAMRANHSYWSTVSATTAFTYSANGLVPAVSNTLPTTSNFCTASCTPTLLAEYDVQNWVTNLNSVLPNPVATIYCAIPASALTAPGCYITVTWHEENVAINTNAVGNTMASPSYTLYVVP